jgi:hypothetical protein
VVDYDCPQGTADWVRSNHPSVKLVKVNNERIFNISKARNIGAKHSVGDMLCFVDADIEIASGFLEWFTINSSLNKFYLLEPQKLRQGNERLKGLYGLVVCTREQFEAIGGYDDVIAGWGCEDLDFYWRLKKAGYDANLFPVEIVANIISHDDSLRTSYYGQDKETSDLVAGYYIAAKYKLESRLPIMNIARDLKELLYNQAVAGSKREMIEFEILSSVSNHTISFSITEAEMLAIKKTIRKAIKPSSKTRKPKKVAKWKIPLYLVKLILSISKAGSVKKSWP